MSTSPMVPHEQAYAYCAYCPKVCRFSCPVSEAAASETVSPWGKMTAAHLVATGVRPMDEGASKAVHACAGCGRCTSFCKHDNKVGFALFAARGEAIQRGVQPKGAASTLATFAQSQNPFGVELGPLVARFRAQSPVRYPLFPGCGTLVKSPEIIEDTLAVAAAFGAPMGVARAASKCCGYPLYAAGAMTAFIEHARSMAASLEAYPELVVADPGCAHTMKVVYAQVGVEVPSRIRTVVEVLAENLEHAPAKAPLPITVGYHDACHLGRGLGQYDAPRQLLRRAVTTVLEAASVRAEAGCSGGGGLLPRTLPDVAVEVARRQAKEVVGDEDASLVSACTTSRRMFERSGRSAFDLVTLLRKWVEA